MKKLLVLLCFALCLLCACGRQDTPIQAGSVSESPAAEKSGVFDLDAFYGNPVTQDYADIRTLDEDYDAQQAQLDGCFVIGPTVHNDHLYREFMAHVQNHEDAFIRVAQTTIEGDLILQDLLYDSSADKVRLVFDFTRDAFAAQADRIITLREFDGTAEYSYDNHLYWIVYRGTLADVEFESEDMFVVAVIQ